MVPAREAVPAQTRSAPEWLLLVMWRRKWLILACILISGMGGLCYLNFATPLYVGKARIYVQQLGLALGPNQQATQTGNENFRQTQRELITSEPVLSAASTRIGPIPALSVPGKPPVQRMKDLVTADLDRGNDIISVTAAAPSAADSVAIANEVVKAYMAYQTDQTRKTTTGETQQTLEAKMKEVENELTAANNEMRQLEQEHGLLPQKDERANQVMRRLQMLSDSLIEAQRETINAKSVFEEAKRVLGPRAAAVDTNPLHVDPTDESIGLGAEDPQLIRSEVLQTQALLQELQQRYLPNHPSIIALKRRLERRNVDFVRAVEVRYRVAEQKEQEYQKRYNEAQMQAIDVSKYVAEYGRVQEKADRLKRELDNLTANVQGLDVLRKAGVLSIDVVEWAAPETKPSLPNPKTAIPISLALGLMGGLLMACIWEWVDDRFHSARDMRSSLGMPLLAVIPQSATKRSPSVLGQRILLDPASDAAEAYRALRTAVQFAAPPGQLRTLLITSPSAGDGKTTLVSNLAIAMAQSGKRVIVVDADLRKPSQHEIFGVKNNTGLSMLLAGRCSLETATQRASVQGLDILPCGPIPANPSEILNSNEFGDVLEQLAEKYDYVLLDSPPVAAVPDARTMAGLCDSTLIVLKAQTAHRRQTEQTRDALLSVGAKVIGLVVNDLPTRTRGGAYGQSNPGQRRLVAGLTSQDQEVLQSRSK